MKVFDIISESRDLNESIKSIKTWYAFVKLFGNGPRKDAAEYLGKKWSKELYFDDAITSAPADILKGPHAKFANDAKVIDAAKVYAEEAAAKAGWAAKRAVAANVYRLSADGMIFVGNLAAAGFLFVAPAKEYYAQMEVAEQKLAAKEITEEQFAAIRQHQMSILTGKIAVALAASAFTKGLFGPAVDSLRAVAKFNKSIAGPASILADILSGLKIAGNVYAADLLNNGWLGKMVAELFSIGIVQETVGARATDIVDTVKEKLGKAQPTDKVGKGDAAKPSPAQQAAIDATSQPPAPQKFDTTAPLTSVNQIRDPKTGQIRQKYADEY